MEGCYRRNCNRWYIQKREPRAGLFVLARGSFIRGGGYLLSHFRSIIGVVGVNFSVRNGKRWNPHAITT